MLFIPEKLKQTLKPLKPWVLHPIGEYKLMRQYQKASRKIFIDCGANTGKVLENAMKKRKGFEFYAFEPQPELVELGNRIKTGYPFVPFHFYPKAVWTDDGKLNFFLLQHGQTILKEALLCWQDILKINVTSIISTLFPLSLLTLVNGCQTLSGLTIT